MKFSKPVPLVELAILLFAAWQARDLPNAWQHSPHDQFGWVALLAWLTPLAAGLAGSRRAGLAASPWMLGAALIAGSLAELTELHVFGHVALALSIGAWSRPSRRSLLWLAAAVAWMPMFGWWLSDVSSGAVLALRLLVALAGAVCLWLPFKLRVGS